MPKAMLKFDLPEETEEFNTAIHGGDYKAILWNLDQYLRAKVKYGELPDDAHAAYQDARDELHRELSDRGLDIQ